MQLTAPVVLEKVPNEQAIHEDAPDSEQYPLLQFVQFDGLFPPAPPKQVPFKHDEQFDNDTEARSMEYVPDGH